MRVLLFSNGKGPDGPLSFGLPQLEKAIKDTGAKNFIFIPYAVIRDSHEKRTALMNDVLSKFGANVKNIETFEDPVKAIEECDGILVSGGNTWVLNRTLHDNNLIGPIRKAVLKDGKPYVGWSAGTNVATTNIRTTNDMPIITGAVLPALSLVPFQINPHYLDAKVEGHNGETRDERLEEFCTVNKHEPVIAIREMTLLEVDDTKLKYHSPSGSKMKIFKYDFKDKKVSSEEFDTSTNLDYLLKR